MEFPRPNSYNFILQSDLRQPFINNRFLFSTLLRRLLPLVNFKEILSLRKFRTKFIYNTKLLSPPIYCITQISHNPSHFNFTVFKFLYFVRFEDYSSYDFTDLHSRSKSFLLFIKNPSTPLDFLDFF